MSIGYAIFSGIAICFKLKGSCDYLTIGLTCFIKGSDFDAATSTPRRSRSVQVTARLYTVAST